MNLLLDCYINTLGWTEAQVKTIVLLPKVPGALSALGSGYIIYDTMKEERKRKSPYHRIMAAMSVLEFLVSFFGAFMSSWPMPKGYQVYAVGNNFSCGVSGFFYVLGMVGTAMYNCSLTTHHTLVIKHKWTKYDIQDIEKWYHIIPWTVCLTFAILPFVFGISGPGIAYGCW